VPAGFADGGEVDLETRYPSGLLGDHVDELLGRDQVGAGRHPTGYGGVVDGQPATPHRGRPDEPEAAGDRDGDVGLRCSGVPAAGVSTQRALRTSAAEVALEPVAAEVAAVRHVPEPMHRHFPRRGGSSYPGRILS
jgi:hypothetical protein